METHTGLTFKMRTSATKTPEKGKGVSDKKQILSMNITTGTEISSHCSAERHYKNVELHTELSVISG